MVTIAAAAAAVDGLSIFLWTVFIEHQHICVLAISDPLKKAQNQALKINNL